MKINVGISNRHIHLNKEDYKILFNEDEFTKKKDLSQPGQFASEMVVSIEGPKGKIDNVRVLGPVREYTQVEVSKTDCYKLGINPPIRYSGEIEGSSELTIIGKYGSIKRNCAIIHQRHIHASFEEKEKYNLKDYYDVVIDGEKPTILKNVKVIYGNFKLELHLDTDDANGCNLKEQDLVDII